MVFILMSILFISSGHCVLSGCNVQVRGLELAHNTSFDLKMKYEETQLFEVMLGQMSEYSKDHIKECEVGRESFVILSQCLNVCKRVSREPVR